MKEERFSDLTRWYLPADAKGILLATPRRRRAEFMRSIGAYDEETMNRNPEVLKLPTPADLSQVSLEFAIAMLKDKGDEPDRLCCAVDSFSETFSDWMWVQHRRICVSVVPSQILKHPQAWALAGYDHAVISE